MTQNGYGIFSAWQLDNIRIVMWKGVFLLDIVGSQHGMLGVCGVCRQSIPMDLGEKHHQTNDVSPN